MGITIAKKPELDINGQRWVEFAPGAKILVCSIANTRYSSAQALVRRHLATVAQASGVGTATFNVEAVENVDHQADDDLFVGLAAKYLIRDWSGVDLEDRPGEPAVYTPELGKELIKQMPSVYYLALRTADEIAKRIEEQAQATAEKQ